ncbi:hypothetical protein NCC78_02165 [Micromonospora phytophila]|uniref:hypothetical protein n=1 Tax=Micromonospora phytophila TaxID=709888 RepID=UPI00202F06D9|nr:hypothetical protein [Micromonospora phytophila]MCM0673531.1 hypothetical protein [Micromonospora phytophila]
MSSGEAGGARRLRLIGYWSGPGEEHWPDPALFIDSGADPSRLRWVGEYLRSGTVFVAAAGTSPCRLCGIANGSTELTDGVHFVWPQGLAHYVEAHNVRLPDEITQLMVQSPAPVDVEAFERDILETGNVVIDDGWWRSTYGSGS